jgi:dienelactone hydrolase
VAEFSPNRLARSARRFVTDPRVVGVARALPRTAAVLNRARAPHAAGGIPAVRVSPGLAAQVLLDEVLISVMRDPKLFPKGDDYERAAADIGTAHALWAERGWLIDPAAYHADPPVPAPVTIGRERAMEQRYEHLSFASRYEPPSGVPGRDRWLAQQENRTAHAWLLRHADPAAPWLVCLHGFGMGHPSMDLRGFRAANLHWNLGLNVALVVLPVHGPRQAPGRHRGEGFMSIDLIDSVHGLAQAAWDTRSVIRWIRAASRPDVPVGVYGISLGGYTAALVASLEQGLSCAIAGIPFADLPDLYRRHSPPRVRRRAFETGALGPEADAVHSVVSPLALRPLLPRDRRFIFAGIGDRMSTAGQARRLWEHWEQPSIEWYPGGHIGFFMAGAVQRYVTDALVTSGMVPLEAAATAAVSSPRADPTPSAMSHRSGTSSRQATKPKPISSM